MSGSPLIAGASSLALVIASRCVCPPAGSGTHSRRSRKNEVSDTLPDPLELAGDVKALPASNSPLAPVSSSARQISPVPLVLLKLLPAGPEEQEALRLDRKRSAWGGAAFLVVLMGSLLWTLVEACVVLLSPADVNQ